MASTPIYWNVLAAIQTQITTYLDLTAVGTYAAIPAGNVVIRPVPFATRGMQEWGRDEQTPGIIISPARTLAVPEELGNVGDDDVLYPVLVQVIDNQFERTNSDQLKSWLAWGQGVRQLFSQSNLRSQVPSVGIVQVAQQDVLDERLWGLNERCVMATALRVLSRETPNANGVA